MSSLKAIFLISILCVSVRSFAGGENINASSMVDFQVKETSSNEYSLFRFSMINDNPFLNLLSIFATDDDFGRTHGVNLNYSWTSSEGVILKGRERWQLALNTELYTKDMTPPGQDLFPNVPQKFREITTIDLSVDNILRDSDGNEKLYYIVGAGVGLMNEKNNKNYMAVGQQTAWHNYKHKNLTPETTPLYVDETTDLYKNFLSIKGAVGKVVAFNSAMKDCQCEMDRFKIEGGAEVISISSGSQVYFLMELNKTLFKWKNTKFNVDTSFKSTAYTNGDIQYDKYAGLQLKRSQLSVQTGMQYTSGDLNEDFYGYPDKDPIWNLFVEYRWGGNKGH